MEQDVQKKEAVSRAIQDALELQDPSARDIPLSNDYMQQRRTFQLQESLSLYAVLLCRIVTSSLTIYVRGLQLPYLHSAQRYP